MDENKLLINEMKYLKLGKKPVEWVIPKADGLRPPARICATMKFYEELSIIVIYGGCDKERKRFYSDLFIFVLRFVIILTSSVLFKNVC